MAESLEKAKKAAQKVQYDFRLGLDLEKIVYRDKRQINCKEVTIYIIIMVLYWALVIAYYSLWHHFYLEEINTTFYILISLTGTLFIIWLVFAVLNFKAYAARKEQRKFQKEEAKRLEEEEKDQLAFSLLFKDQEYAQELR